MDREARFRALFVTAYPALHRYARNRGLTRPDADDLVAATLEVAWRRIEDVPSDEPLPWLFAVAHNLARNKMRADWRREALVARLPYAAPDAGSPESSRVDLETLRHALARLDEDDRELLRLVAWDGLTPSQAAAALGCSAIAARSRLHRARKRLARLLGIGWSAQRRDVSKQIPGVDSHPKLAMEVLDD